MTWEGVVAFLSIVVIDLALAGDNALVIAMAVRTLPDAERRKGILWGTVAAVLLRVAATFVAAQLLRLPFLSALGGMLVVWIAVKLLRQDGGPAGTREATTFTEAIRVIMLADFIMSTDNILAIAGASRGSFPLLLFGLGLSIPIVVFCSALIARLMNRYPWLVSAGAAVLGWTGGVMIVDDRLVHGAVVRHVAFLDWVFPLVVAAGVIAVTRAWTQWEPSAGRDPGEAA